MASKLKVLCFKLLFKRAKDDPQNGENIYISYLTKD